MPSRASTVISVAVRSAVSFSCPGALGEDLRLSDGQRPARLHDPVAVRWPRVSCHSTSLDRSLALLEDAIEALVTLRIDVQDELDEAGDKYTRVGASDPRSYPA
jgi:hypothetical protein